jgi:hypothetical protein
MSMVKNMMFHDDERPFHSGIGAVISGHGRFVSEAKWSGAAGDVHIVALQTLPNGTFPGGSVPNGRRLRS